MSRLQVGRTTVDITPRPGLPLMGNFRDDYAARGMHDPLSAQAIVLADEQGEKIGLLTIDVCMLDRGMPVEIVNSGVGGSTTERARARFEKDVLDHQPELVLIMLGANDSAVDVWKNPPAGKAVARAVWRSRFSRRYPNR